MHSSLGRLACLSFAISAALAQSTSVETPPAPDLAEWSVACPPAPTVFISVTETEYVPLTSTTTASYHDTTTLPITIFQTIISTTVLTTTEIVTETSTTVSITPTTATLIETSTTLSISPTTDTLTETSVTVSISPTTATATLTETSITVSISPTTDTLTETSVTVSISPTTDTLTETSITVSISPTTATDTLTETSTTVSTTPTTETATEIISLYSVTSQATSITLCPTRIANPTFTALGPYPTDWTWGCPPGWLCKPLQENCNFEAGIPDQNFYCSPNECIPANALPSPLPTWDLDIYGNVTPATDPSLHINAIQDYFNMNPTDFGLTYEIFVVNEVFTLTTTILLPPSPTVAARQAQTSIPGACYPWCNNCLLEAQAKGKTSALCVPGSAFEVSLVQCEQCIDYHKSDNSGSFVEIAPQFQQFLDYCDQFSTVAVTTSVVATTTNAAGSTYSTLSGTLSTTVIPTSSPPPSSPATHPTSVVTIVSSTATPTSASQPYTTTAIVLTTSYSHVTVSGPAWSQVTIFLPLSDNSTTTVYGTDLKSGGATLVLPTSPTTASHTTTMTVTPGEEVSSGSIVTASTSSGHASTTSGSSDASGTTSGSPSAFTGAAAALRPASTDTPLRSTLLGFVIGLAFMLVLL
ncbi:uncharacterized protein PV07_06079 [Cladophialophora immunda]|uniref:Uncharacterized protein n=1 Tax=Cladophialophora immunda TaxID=569365 RepID=A0A0D2D3P0_9EURO|nr:uncharacterized protein PV07_06079 [Cladophialophora immunda]KIW30329.1 hypothetical protein PV07_06079 [Cladophialophora immunda]